MNLEHHLWPSLQVKGMVPNGNIHFYKSNNKYVSIPFPHVPGTVLDAAATTLSKRF